MFLLWWLEIARWYVFVNFSPRFFLIVLIATVIVSAYATANLARYRRSLVLVGLLCAPVVYWPSRIAIGTTLAYMDDRAFIAGGGLPRPNPYHVDEDGIPLVAIHGCVCGPDAQLFEAVNNSVARFLVRTFGPMEYPERWPELDPRWS